MKREVASTEKNREKLTFLKWFILYIEYFIIIYDKH